MASSNKYRVRHKSIRSGRVYDPLGSGDMLLVDHQGFIHDLSREQATALLKSGFTMDSGAAKMAFESAVNTLFDTRGAYARATSEARRAAAAALDDGEAPAMLEDFVDDLFAGKLHLTDLVTQDKIDEAKRKAEEREKSEATKRRQDKLAILAESQDIPLPLINEEAGKRPRGVINVADMLALEQPAPEPAPEANESEVSETVETPPTREVLVRDDPSFQSDLATRPWRVRQETAFALGFQDSGGPGVAKRATEFLDSMSVEAVKKAMASLTL